LSCISCWSWNLRTNLNRFNSCVIFQWISRIITKLAIWHLGLDIHPSLVVILQIFSDDSMLFWLRILWSWSRSFTGAIICDMNYRRILSCFWLSLLQMKSLINQRISLLSIETSLSRISWPFSLISWRLLIYHSLIALIWRNNLSRPTNFN